MEFSGSKNDLIKKISSIPEGSYHIIVVAEKTAENRTYWRNRINALVRTVIKQNRLFAGSTVKEAKSIIMEELGYTYIQGDEMVVRSTEKLTLKELEQLTVYLNELTG
jgi:hypothetical protein